MNSETNEVSEVKKLSDIFPPELVEYYKQNKNLITEELLDTLRTYGNDGKALALEILDTPMDDEKYHLDAFGNRIFFNGNRQLKRPFTKMPIAKIHEIEIKKCADDIYYFMNNYIRITTPKGLNFPELREYQREFIYVINKKENEKIISLQPRQSGKSVSVGIWILHVFLFQKDLTIGIASNKLSMSKEFVDKVKKMFLTVPMWLQCGILNWNVATIEGENRIKILSDTASDSSFRGFSVNYLIVDEASWIMGTDSSGTSFKAFADSVFPAQEALANKKTILISTANGKNHFYDIWEGAGETKETSDNGYVKYEVKWQNVPRHKPTGELYEPEEFRNSVIKSYGAVFFNQNYGNEFIGSSNTLIDGKVLAKYQYQQPDFVRNPGLKIYEEPIKGHSYIFGVDSAKDGSDSFAIQVLDITNFNFRQVATAKLKIDYLRMPEFIDDWAKYFNNAFVIVENNEGAGQSVADRLYLEFEYENLYFDKSRTSVGSKKKYPGFRTTKKSRDIILQTLKTMAESDKLLIQDKDTIDELFNFVLKDNKYQADNNKHDDLVMALALCFAIFAEARNFNEMNEIVKELDSKSSDSDLNVSDYLIIGNFDILTDDSNNDYLNDEDFSSKFGSFDYIE
nr:MAG TPA: large terminase protein [Caudoviricetes sp.]